MDWAVKMAESLRDNEDELMPWKTLPSIAAALRQAKQVGRDEAEEAVKQALLVGYPHACIGAQLAIRALKEPQ